MQNVPHVYASHTMRSFFAQQDHFALRYRLSEFPEHMTSMPKLAQVISLVG